MGMANEYPTINVPTDPLDEVLAMKQQHAGRWRDQPDSYWLARMMQEVGELSSSLVGDHEDPPEWELTQIASIALNWLEVRQRRGGSS